MVHWWFTIRYQCPLTKRRSIRSARFGIPGQQLDVTPLLRRSTSRHGLPTLPEFASEWWVSFGDHWTQSQRVPWRVSPANELPMSKRRLLRTLSHLSIKPIQSTRRPQDYLRCWLWLLRESHAWVSIHLFINRERKR